METVASHVLRETSRGALAVSLPDKREKSFRIREYQPVLTQRGWPYSLFGPVCLLGDYL